VINLFAKAEITKKNQIIVSELQNRLLEFTGETMALCKKGFSLFETMIPGKLGFVFP
jgi:hypothetical protein